jgi:hypothetical protein
MSCVSRIRLSCAAHAKTARSSAPESPTCCTRTMSRFGRRRSSPQTAIVVVLKNGHVPSERDAPRAEPISAPRVA